MRDREKYAAIRGLVDPLLSEHGFSAEGSVRATYYQIVNDDLCHFIMFNLIGRSRTQFDVYVFPSSRRFGDAMWARFPDSVGIISGRKAGLNAKLGVGHGASRFSCVTVSAITSAVTIAVLPALEQFAFSYLAQFKQLNDLVPILEYPQWASLIQ
jgi:hypothetical protein